MKKRLLLGIFLIVLTLVILPRLILSHNFLAQSTTLSVRIEKYARAEHYASSLSSRTAMTNALNVAKLQNFAPAVAARFYAYTASVYADTLEHTTDSKEAEKAVYAFMKKHTISDQKTSQLVNDLVQDSTLSEKAQKIVDDYEKRSLEDNYTLSWDQKIPPGKDMWFVRNNKIDKGAMSGQWRHWILTGNEQFDVPKPPKTGSIEDQLEMAMVTHAVNNRHYTDLSTVYFWHGSSGFEKGAMGDNITPAGVWQNILFVEKGNQLSDIEYAKAQKILAQSIADSFIEAWKVKYKYYTQRPSMRIKDLSLVVADPPFPSYVSGHSTISFTAATVLSHLFPEKKDVWVQNAIDARNSRLLAGIHFDTDNQNGAYLGEQVGNIIIKKLGAETKPTTYSKPLLLHQIALLYTLKYQYLLGSLASQNSLFSLAMGMHAQDVQPDASFTNITAQSGITTNNTQQGASWTDYNNDGLLDIYIPNQLYKNTGNGTFTETTPEAGIKTHKQASMGVFGDYDNDGCEDLYIAQNDFDEKMGTVGTNDILYHNNCNGTFTEVTSTAGIYDTYQGTSGAWGDYDSDGYIDLYVANFGIFTTSGHIKEPNILYRNNRNGTFTNTTKEAGVDGYAKCPNFNFEPYSKSAYQPVWFDYNNDNLLDLFVAVDGGVSPLYKNNGDGTFTDVTYEAGLCREGTGMGVTVEDYDKDSDFDIFVTNTGRNYLWRNNGKGAFVENSEAANLNDFGVGWGTSFFDYDNDGWLDLYIIKGAHDTQKYKTQSSIKLNSEDVFYQSNHDGTFNPVSKKLGLNDDEIKKGAAFGDFNNDGFVDVLVIAGSRDLKANNRFYKNNGNENNWITIQLVGTKSNRQGIGAKITVYYDDFTQIRQVLRGDSYLSQNSPWLTFGIGKATQVNKVEILWPSGTNQVLTKIKPNQKIVVEEK